MMRPLWPLLTLVAAAADKNKALVVTDPEEKPLYLFGHIPKCGGVSFVADLVGRLHLTSCFGRKAVEACLTKEWGADEAIAKELKRLGLGDASSEKKPSGGRRKKGR